MPNHPGDPRSDALGEQKYDESEYPYYPYTPPQGPPVPGNASNFIPWRGQEQHGVQITRAPEDPAGLPYKEEQIARDNYHDVTVTPRDITGTPPIRVQVIEPVNLIRQRKSRLATYSLAVGSQVRIAQRNLQRLFLKVNVSQCGQSGATSQLLFTHSQSPIVSDSYEFWLTDGGSHTVVESEATDGLSVMLLSGTATAVRVSVWQEYYLSDGEALL